MNIDPKYFIPICKQIVAEKESVTNDSVFVVWTAKTLKNNKAILGTLMTDNLFEITYNGYAENGGEIYVDVYEKKENYMIDHEEIMDRSFNIASSTLQYGLITPMTNAKDLEVFLKNETRVMNPTKDITDRMLESESKENFTFREAFDKSRTEFNKLQGGNN